MERKYNLWSFILCLLLLALSLQALYAAHNHSWSVAPPASVLWLLTVITFLWVFRNLERKEAGEQDGEVG